MNNRQIEILKILDRKPEISSSEIRDDLDEKAGTSTIKRDLQFLINEDFVEIIGQGKGTRYLIGPKYRVFGPIFLDQYFEQEIDQRKILDGFNFELISGILTRFKIFTSDELKHLESLQSKYLGNIAGLSKSEYDKELERLSIDLSWKSSQIEGNTYSLLETERLLKEKHTASGKTKEEAIMLLNHKEAIDFIIENPNYIKPLSVKSIEDIHSILTKELGVSRNIRKRRVGISGTNYRPIDNEFQIREAFESMCKLINSKSNVFEKSYLALILISYIQGFNDGNKRTARIISNAILMNSKHCPMSFRTVDSIGYKKAMLIFYEQNNIANFKKIYIEQYEFAVNTYF